MKKTMIWLCLILLLVCGAALAEAQQDEAAQEEAQEGEIVLGEGEILMHGYIDPVTGYYLGVPADWAILGPGSTATNLAEAVDIMEDVDVYGIFRSFGEKDSYLMCRNKDGAGVTVTYGSSDGVTNDTLIDAMEDIQAQLSASLSGLVFKEDSGKYSFKGVMDILFLDMSYKNTSIFQYYMVTGSQMYVFTFTNTPLDIAQTVLSTFAMSNA